MKAVLFKVSVGKSGVSRYHSQMAELGRVFPLIFGRSKCKGIYLCTVRFSFTAQSFGMVAVLYSLCFQIFLEIDAGVVNRTFPDFHAGNVKSAD